ncbi:Uncharacterized protein dnm_025210 [Desulfonema magnum]|uniref:Uncharacterized protein n=1 Tax=Desulfonema magnum TaxID=45655 RepID=A0A975BJH0_9BACT|nr:Uncharacterized protein dnm_025210 [Desulfonema magnum]
MFPKRDVLPLLILFSCGRLEKKLQGKGIRKGKKADLVTPGTLHAPQNAL